MIDVEALHRAAERIGTEYGTSYMDGLADTIAAFIQESNLTDEHGVTFEPDYPSLGYGVMLGVVAMSGA
jgi:hypothetical protein